MALQNKQTSIELVSQNNARIRVTQTFIDVVWIASPPVSARVTQVYIEVPHILSAPVSISLACPVTNTVAVGQPYSGSMVVTGGTAPFTFALIGGSLPPGITLNTSTGLISGTTAIAGNFEYTIQVTDVNGLTAQASCSLIVTGGPPPPPGGTCPPAWELHRVVATLREQRHVPVRGSLK